MQQCYFAIIYNAFEQCLFSGFNELKCISIFCTSVADFTQYSNNGMEKRNFHKDSKRTRYEYKVQKEKSGRGTFEKIDENLCQ